MSASLSLVLLLATAGPMPVEQARSETLAVVEAADPRLRENAAGPWDDMSPDATPAAILDAAVQSLYLSSKPTRSLVSLIGEERFDASRMEPLLAELDAEQPFVATNVRTYLGRQLAIAGSIDEAALMLETLDLAQAIDPAAALFYRAVCEHNALEKEAGLETIRLLLDETDLVPTRYKAVARLMRQDLEDLADNEMAKVAHDMKNVERRLQQGRSGEKTQEQEQKILGDLDKMIEQMQQQLQQMQGGQAGGGGSDKPADDSRIAGNTAPGEVDERPVGRTAGWGNLPEKQRTEAKNLINRQFPSHYRQAVEEYLKRLAERPAK